MMLFHFKKRKEQTNLSLRRKLNIAIDSLGGSEREVFQSLKLLDVKGYIGSRTQCPVARYLKEVLSEEVVCIMVRDDQITICPRNFVPIFSVDNPLQIGHFVRLFDRETYPDLVLKIP